MSKDPILEAQKESENISKKEILQDDTVLDHVPVTCSKGTELKPSEEDAKIHNNVKKQEALRRINNEFEAKLAVVNRMLEDAYVNIKKYTREVEATIWKIY